MHDVAMTFPSGGGSALATTTFVVDDCQVLKVWVVVLVKALKKDSREEKPNRLSQEQGVLWTMVCWPEARTC
ncbi:hypothetical protein ACFX2I_007456 [Malus domestica]